MKTLVVELLEKLADLETENAALREEVARLKGLKGRPKLRPSGMQRETQARAKAIEHLERALKLAPRSPTGYYYMGQLRKACGEQGQAGKMFRKVLALRPEHVEASRELRLLQRRHKESTDSGPGGLFGFGRKKK